MIKSVYVSFVPGKIILIVLDLIVKQLDLSYEYFNFPLILVCYIFIQVLLLFDLFLLLMDSVL